MTDSKYIVRTQDGSYEDLTFDEAQKIETNETNRGREVTITPRTKR